MEKETFVKIIDALVEWIDLIDKFNKLLNSDIDFGMSQVIKIIWALEEEFEDVEKWIHWWLFDAGTDKEIILQGTHYKLSTAGDLFDLLDYKNANS